MSFEVYGTTGYGIVLSNIVFNEEKLIKYCVSNGGDKEEVKKSLDSEDFEEVAEMIIDSIKNSEDIQLTWFSDENNDVYLLFPPLFPWEKATEKEKNLIPDELYRIINDMVHSISDTKEDIKIDYYSPINFG